LSLYDGFKSRITKRPWNLEYAVTYCCNARCVQCKNWKYRDERGELNLDEIKEIFESYRGFKVVGITGGEPTLRHDLLEIIETVLYSQKKLKRLFITTNGAFPKVLEDLAEHLALLKYRRKFKKLTFLISLDAYPELHNKIRGVKIYNKAIESVERLVEIKEKFKFKKMQIGTISVYSPWNYKEFFYTLGLIEHLAEEFGIEPSICIWWWSGNLYKLKSNLNTPNTPNTIPEHMLDLDYWIPKIQNVLKKTKTSLTDARRWFYDLARLWLRNNPSRQVIPCAATKSRYYMNPYGEIYPCIIMSDKIASLRELNYDLNRVFRSNKLKAIREKISSHKCENCLLTCELIPSMMTYPEKLAFNLLKSKIISAKEKLKTSLLYELIKNIT